VVAIGIANISLGFSLGVPHLFGRGGSQKLSHLFIELFVKDRFFALTCLI